MALITCPECKREISDTAVSCPHCGYSFPAPQKVETDVRTTAITYSKKHPIIGIVFIIGGGITTLFGLLFLPFGLIISIPGFIFLGAGFSMCGGQAKVVCPYCGKESLMTKSAMNFKCAYCKKVSVRNGEELHTVN